MIVLNKTITSEFYHLNCELKIEKKIDINLLWDLCSIPNSKVIYLDIYNEEMNKIIIQYECSQSKDFDLFKTECINDNIDIKNPLYWELCLEINGCDINLCYEQEFENILTMYMDGTKQDIDDIINILSNIDDKHIKVVK